MGTVCVCGGGGEGGGQGAVCVDVCGRRVSVSRGGGRGTALVRGKGGWLDY